MIILKNFKKRLILLLILLITILPAPVLAYSNFLIASGKTIGIEVNANGVLIVGFYEVEGKEIHLMPMEYSLLCLLAKNVGKVLTYRYILEKVWSNALESDLASLRVYMASLRKKIEPNTHDPIYIQTHIGIGYRMIRTESK